MKKLLLLFAFAAALAWCLSQLVNLEGTGLEPALGESGLVRDSGEGSEGPLVPGETERAPIPGIPLVGVDVNEPEGAEAGSGPVQIGISSGSSNGRGKDPESRPDMDWAGRQELVGGILSLYRSTDDTLDEQGPFVDGVREGVWRSYASNGVLILEGEYRGGVAVGVWTGWHDNGKRSLEASVVDGEFHGSVHFWSEGGELDKERSGVYVSGVKR